MRKIELNNLKKKNVKLYAFPSSVLWNLNLPGSQRHNFHLLEEQAMYPEYEGTLQEEQSPLWSGLSTTFPFYLSFFLFELIFWFADYMWDNQICIEVYLSNTDLCPFSSRSWGFESFIIYFFILIWFLFQWFENIKFESLEGYHTEKVNSDYKLGFMLFLASEIMFFFSIFWAFLHFSLTSTLDFGYIWPPEGIEPIYYMNLPLFNTVVLVSSGIFVTWAHSLLKKEKNPEIPLLWTIILASVFLIFQLTEYMIARFNINDSVFGSIFYFGTGFHGFHVMIGTIALIYNYEKLKNGELSSRMHQSFLFAIIYWHFVDVIWLLLFIIFYKWGQ
jgi:cytochrome c oxidase subunit 3